MRKGGAAADGEGKKMAKRAGQPYRVTDVPHEPHWIDLRRHERAHAVERVAKDESHALHAPEQVRREREPAPSDPLEVERGAAGLEHPPLDFGDLEVGIDFLPNSTELARAFEVVDAFAKRRVAHHFARAA
jgi:hypothetical protein